MDTSEAMTTCPGEPFIERCPQCVGHDFLRPIARNVLRGSGEALCMYRCGRCWHLWMTSWSTYGEDAKYLTSFGLL